MQSATGPSATPDHSGKLGCGCAGLLLLAIFGNLLSLCRGPDVDYRTDSSPNQVGLPHSQETILDPIESDARALRAIAATLRARIGANERSIAEDAVVRGNDAWERAGSAGNTTEAIEAYRDAIASYRGAISITAVRKDSNDIWRQGETRVVYLPHEIELELVWIPAGSFTMGSAPVRDGLFDRRNEEPQRTVTFEAGFWMGKTPVTQRQWKAVMGETWFSTIGEELPAASISKVDARRFIRQLNTPDVVSGLPKGRFRLPSEAEWEYACRAGSRSEYYSVESRDRFGDYVWYRENSSQLPPVGRKRPNAWGIHDMLGTVWEWVDDDYHPNYRGAPTDGSAWIHTRHGTPVARGGHFGSSTFECRCAYRRSPAQLDGYYGHVYGMRVVWTRE